MRWSAGWGGTYDAHMLRLASWSVIGQFSYRYEARDLLTSQIRRRRECTQLFGLDCCANTCSHTATKQGPEADLDMKAHLQIPECEHGIECDSKITNCTEA